MAHDQSLLVETEASLPTISLDLSGTWRIEEEDKSYEAILDVQGNGAYTWQGGTIVTTKVENRLWEGTWSQPENDREGGFEVLLSKDFSRAEGAWWYTRVKNFRNIPPGITGGSYVLIRLPPIHTDKRRAHEED
ncbi:MAG: hypothetical protein GKS05_09125 [Nitrospirales bacterium]|nr:hypothetical protein [Nitrospirales bacterium]